MVKSRIGMWATAAAIVLAVTVLGCSGPAPTEVLEVAEASEGAFLLQDRCSKHHSLDRVERADKTGEEWEQTVVRMVGKGASLREDEQAVLEVLRAGYKGK